MIFRNWMRWPSWNGNMVCLSTEHLVFGQTRPPTNTLHCDEFLNIPDQDFQDQRLLSDTRVMLNVREDANPRPEEGGFQSSYSSVFLRIAFFGRSIRFLAFGNFGPVFESLFFPIGSRSTTTGTCHASDKNLQRIARKRNTINFKKILDLQIVS